MIPKFRAWSKNKKVMSEVKKINFWSEELDTVAFEGKFLEDVELMQSTGLKDKNEKEVFVGDIIRCTRGCHHEVYWEKEYGGTYVGGMPAVYLKGLLSGYAWTGDEEIIGNVYQNPELLEADHDRT